MLFPEDALFGLVLIDQAEAMGRHPTPAANPLTCDRWVARSAVQKAIRRGDVETAQRALANLFSEDRSSAWRHLIVIALEDIGVANLDVLARIVGARLDKVWRNQMGGDWPVLAELVRQMAESNHCQAACDLLLQATNLPDWESERHTALTINSSKLCQWIRSSELPIEQRAIAVLAIGGGLVDQQTQCDPNRVFYILGAAGYASHVLAVCQAAWRASRNPMALLLPLVWHEWMNGEGHMIVDDEISATQFFGRVPAYAIDQFTRIGGSVARAYLAASSAMRNIMDEACFPAGKRPRAVGDLLFLLEGSVMSRRTIWTLGERLRQPVRMLSSITKWEGLLLCEAFDVLRSQSAQIADLREQHFNRAMGEAN